MARLTFAHAWEVRFIELMPFGEVANFAHNAVVPYQETMAQIEQALGPLIAVPGYDGHDPSRPYRLAGAQGTLGFISSGSHSARSRTSARFGTGVASLAMSWFRSP